MGTRARGSRWLVHKKAELRARIFVDYRIIVGSGTTRQNCRRMYRSRIEIYWNTAETAPEPQVLSSRTPLSLRLTGIHPIARPCRLIASRIRDPNVLSFGVGYFFGPLNGKFLGVLEGEAFLPSFKNAVRISDAD